MKSLLSDSICFGNEARTPKCGLDPDN